MDASFREGIAALAVVHEKRGLLDVRFFDGVASSSQEAEVAAILLGMEFVTDLGLLPAVILADSTSAVHQFKQGRRKFPRVSVRWSPRRENRAHDAALQLLRTRISHPDPSSVPQLPKRERAKPVTKQKLKRPLAALPVPDSAQDDWKATLRRFWDRLEAGS